MTGPAVGRRTAEAVCGGLASVLGAGGLAFALLADSMVTVSSTVITSGVCAPGPCPQPSFPAHQALTVNHSSIASGGFAGTLEVLVIAVIVVLALIATGALMHATTTRLPWLVLLGGATGLLLLATLLTGFSIGFAFIPADALAVAAVGLGLVQTPRPSQPAIFPGR